MPGLDDYQATSREYFKQSGFYINFKIQQLYDEACRKISVAYMSTYKGLEGKMVETSYRDDAMLVFQTIFTESINLPNVESKLKAIPADERGFTDKWDLQEKLAKAVPMETPSKDIMRWWMAYSKVLVDSGLVKVFTGDDSPFNKYRR
jgi:hypothetical protein